MPPLGPLRGPPMLFLLGTSWPFHPSLDALGEINHGHVLGAFHMEALPGPLAPRPIIVLRAILLGLTLGDSRLTRPCVLAKVDGVFRKLDTQTELRAWYVPLDACLTKTSLASDTFAQKGKALCNHIWPTLRV